MSMGQQETQAGGGGGGGQTTTKGTVSVRAQADVVARRVVVAGDEGAPAAVASDHGASDASGAPPHDLGVVAAHGAAVAAVGPVVVAGALGEPGGDGLRGRPAGAAAPEEVLAVGPRRVHQRAVPAPGLRVRPRVRRHALVPRQRRQAQRRARRVLLRQELVPHLPVVRRAGVARAGGQDQQRNAQRCGTGGDPGAPPGTRHGMGMGLRSGLPEAMLSCASLFFFNVFLSLSLSVCGCVVLLLPRSPGSFSIYTKHAWCLSLLLGEHEP
jgi:hypothetical protein